MLARDFVTYSLPFIKPTDTGRIALELMDQYKVNHLPLVEDTHYICLISEEQILNRQLEDKRFGQVKIDLFRPCVFENQTIFDVLSLLSNLKISVLPVITKDEKFLGSILIGDLVFHLIQSFGLDQEGAVIQLKIKKIDYSITQIGQIIEANNAKIISFFTIPIDDTNLRIILKLNTKDVISILQTFERFDYEIESVLFDDQKYKELYEERLEALFSYLSI